MKVNAEIFRLMLGGKPAPTKSELIKIVVTTISQINSEIFPFQEIFVRAGILPPARKVALIYEQSQLHKAMIVNEK